MLFDDVNDPYQMKNLADQAEHAQLRKKLEQRLPAELKRITDPFKPAEYYLNRWGMDLKPHTPPGYRSQKKVYTPKLQEKSP